MTEPRGWTLSRVDWDSAFWGREVATARPGAAAPGLDAARLASSGFDLVYALCPTGRLAEVREAEDAGFRTVDLRCEVALRTAPCARRAGVRIVPADSGALVAAADLAGTIHTNTRFANDPGLDRELVAALYRKWIERDAAVPGWEVLVAADGGEVTGYVTHGPGADGSGTIGLIGVGGGARGRGIGGDLLAAAIAAESAAGRPQLRVVTHGGDAGSMAMYKAAGFTVESLHVWLHWHRRPTIWPPSTSPS
jgi:ribosomal protein S18 acetylase RimI-like enzyme